MIKDKLSSEIIQKIEDVILAIGGAAGVKAFDHVAYDRIEWVVNAIYNRIRQAKDEVVEKAFSDDPDIMIDPSDLETISDLPKIVTNVKQLSQVVKDAIIEKAQVKTAKEITEEYKSSILNK